MAAISSLIAIAGVGVAAYGMYENKKAGEAKVAADREAAAAQAEAEALRKQQLGLDTLRRRREVLRQSVAARSASLATMTAQGAANEGSSAPGGSFGGISGRLGVDIGGINQNYELGGGIFDSHQNQLAAYSRAAEAQGRMAFGQGLTSLGGSLVSNAGTIGKVGTYAATQVSNAASFISWDGPTGFLSNPRG